MTAEAGSRSHRRLSKEQVVAAAIEIADRDGLTAVSMRSIGRALQVEAMSLYHHVANKDAVLDLMVDAVMAEFHSPRAEREWRAELRRRSVTAREVLVRHPWAVGLMDSRRNAGFETLRHHDAVLGCLRAAGFSLALTGHAFALLDAHLYGFVIQEISLPFDSGPDLVAMGESMFAEMPEGMLPHLREFAVEVAMQPGYSFGNEFEVGLDLILDGLETRRAAQPG